MFCKSSLSLGNNESHHQSRAGTVKHQKKARKRKWLGWKKKIIPIKNKPEVLSTRNSEIKHINKKYEAKMDLLNLTNIV